MLQKDGEISPRVLTTIKKAVSFHRVHGVFPLKIMFDFFKFYLHHSFVFVFVAPWAGGSCTFSQ